MPVLLKYGNADERLQAAVLNLANLVDLNLPDIRHALGCHGRPELVARLDEAIEVWRMTALDVAREIRQHHRVH